MKQVTILNNRLKMLDGRKWMICILLSLPLYMLAQPAARRAEQQQQAQKSNANNMTTRAQISFPTQTTMSEDVVWRRDIYRELDLNDDANAGLYYPKEPVGTQMNLFTYIFKLMMKGSIKAYKYDPITGSESFEESARVKPLQFLDDYRIFYERQNGRVHLDDSDIPSKEVTAYYLKESAYYDQATATFHTQVLALCPIWIEDDFGEALKKPLFWVKYEDLAPFLAKQTIMTSNLNNAATMSVDDYFTKNMYRGGIYKTTNMLGQSLAKYCNNDETRITAEQKRIEKELQAFEKNLWGDVTRKDSLDSISKMDKKELKAEARKNRRAARSGSTATAKTRRSGSGSSSSGTSAARVTVRRERH